MVSDCEIGEIKKYTRNVSNTLIIELMATQEDNSHYSMEERGLVHFYMVIALINSIFVILNAALVVRAYKKDKEIDWALALVSLSLLF